MSAEQSPANQFARFVTVGVANTTIGLAIIFAAKALLGWGDLAANATGYAIGLLNSFVLNRVWTFGDRGSVRSALPRFLSVFALAYLANLAVVFALRDLAQVNSYVAQTVAVVPYTLLFFLASRTFAFRERRSRQTPSPTLDGSR